jgi:hypothetical protein
MEKVDLDFIARQLDRLISDLADLKHDMAVVIERAERIDANMRAAVERVRITSHGALTELDDMRSRHEPLA